MKKNTLSLLMLLFSGTLIHGQQIKSTAINSSYNDVELSASNAVNFVSTGLDLQGGTTASPQETFIRFEGISLPDDAVINSANLIFYGRTAGTTGTTVTIFGEIGNSDSYPTSTSSTTARAIKERKYTTGSVTWKTPNCIAYQKYETPDIKPLISEMFSDGFRNGNVAFKLTGNQQGPFIVYSYNGNRSYAPQLQINYTSAQGTFTSIITLGEDVGKQTNSGRVSLNNSYSFYGGRSDESINGLIFRNLNIPEGVEIKDAYIEFHSYSTSPAANVNITADINNTSLYMPYDFSLTAREYTKNKINWVTQNLTTDRSKFRTPNLKNIIDEVRIKGWKSNGNIGFKFEGMTMNDGARAYGFASDETYRPRLVIEYLNNNNGPSVDPTLPKEAETLSIVSNSNDDGRENKNGNIYLSSAYLSLGGQSDSNLSAIRFQGVELPHNSEIEDAYIEFYAYTSSAPASITIKTEVGNAKTYSTALNDISKRTYSINTEVWQTEARTDYTFNRTPNLKNLIDENRLRGWESGQNIAFLFEGQGLTGNEARVRAYESGSLYRPRLVIKYKNNNQGPDTNVATNIPNIITGSEKISELYINEVSPQGSVSEKEDWIEIYNNHNQPVFINGNVFISNKESNNKLCELKNILIPAKGFATLIADEKTNKGSFHTNFSLKNSGGTLDLSRSENQSIVLQDQLKYSNVAYANSYGKAIDGETLLTTFIEPSYNASNHSGQQKTTLTFSKERGIYPTGFNLTLSAPEGYTIKYTTNGTFPSASVGNVYTGPIEVNTSMVVKAYAYNATGNSGVAVHTYVLLNNYKNEVPTTRSQWTNKAYILNADEYAKALSELPILAISTDSELTPNWVQGSFEYIDNHLYPERKNFYSNSTTKKYGQVSAVQFNSGVKFKFNKDAEVKKANYPFFDPNPYDIYPTVNKIQTIELKEGQDGPQNNIYNLGYLRFDEKVTMNLMKDMGKYALDTRFVHFFVNGKYRGVKTMRNDYKSNNLEEIFGDDSDNYTTVDLQDANFRNGVVEEGDGSIALWKNICEIAAQKDFQKFKEWVDIEDFIKFQIMYMFIDTEAEATAIFHNYAPKFMKVKLNINDTDGAFFGGLTGTSTSVNLSPRPLAGGGGNYKYKWASSTSRVGPAGLFGHFMGSNTNNTTGNLEFKTLVKDYIWLMIGPASGDMQGRIGASLSVDNVQKQIKKAMQELELPYKLDAAYMSFDRRVYDYWKNNDAPRAIAQVPERVSFTLSKWKEYDMAHTLEYIKFRQENNLVQLTNPNPNTQVYYTIDGSDPMGNDGAVSPVAKLYDPKLGISLSNDKNYLLAARAFAPNNWGPKNRVAVEGGNVLQRAASVEEELLNSTSSDITLYPNPVNDVLNIDLNNSETIESTVEIYKLTGQRILKNALKNSHNEIDTSNLAPGYYVVKIFDHLTQKVSSYKIVKK